MGGGVWGYSDLPTGAGTFFFFFFFSLRFKISPRESQAGGTYMSIIGVPSVARNAYS